MGEDDSKSQIIQSAAASIWPLAVSIGTLVLSIVCAVGGAVKFSLIDRRIADINYEERLDALNTARERLLVVSGQIVSKYGDGYSQPHRLVNIDLTLANEGILPVQVKQIRLETSKFAIDEPSTQPSSNTLAFPFELAPQPPAPAAEEDSPAAAIPPIPIAPAPTAKEPAFDQDQSADGIPDASTIRDGSRAFHLTGFAKRDLPHTKLLMIDALLPDAAGWTRVGQPWIYDVHKLNQHAQAGTIKKGQARNLKLNFLIQDSDRSEIVKFRVTVTHADPNDGDVLSTWTGIIGCGPISKLFHGKVDDADKPPSSVPPAPAPTIQADPSA